MAEIIKNGGTTVFTKNKNELSNFMNQLFRQYIMTYFYQLDNDYVLRLHFKDEANNFEYYIDYTIKFVIEK